MGETCRRGAHHIQAFVNMVSCVSLDGTLSLVICSFMLSGYHVKVLFCWLLPSWVVTKGIPIQAQASTRAPEPTHTHTHAHFLYFSCLFVWVSGCVFSLARSVHSINTHATCSQNIHHMSLSLSSLNWLLGNKLQLMVVVGLGTPNWSKLVELDEQFFLRKSTRNTWSWTLTSFCCWPTVDLQTQHNLTWESEWVCYWLWQVEYFFLNSFITFLTYYLLSFTKKRSISILKGLFSLSEIIYQQNFFFFLTLTFAL